MADSKPTLLIIEDDGNGACLPTHATYVSDYIQEQGSVPPEFVTFTAAAGATRAATGCTTATAAPATGIRGASRSTTMKASSTGR